MLHKIWMPISSVLVHRASRFVLGVYFTLLDTCRVWGSVLFHWAGSWHGSSDVSLQALGRLVLYVLTGGEKPLEQVGIEDLAPNSSDYSEALDLVQSLSSHDERGLEGLSKHPYFWSNQR